MTHYERLGVRPDATSDELRDAYRRAARAAHPDRHGTSSSARMAEVNEAWRILGDAARRGAYDESLAGPPLRPSPRGVPVPGPVPPAPMPPVPPGRVPWRFLLCMAAAGIGIVLIGAMFTDPADPAVPDGILRAGDCVVVGATFDVAEVRCDGAHDAVVQALVPFDQTCPTGTEGFRDRQGMGVACVVRRVPDPAS